MMSSYFYFGNVVFEYCTLCAKPAAVILLMCLLFDPQRIVRNSPKKTTVENHKSVSPEDDSRRTHQQNHGCWLLDLQCPDWLAMQYPILPPEAFPRRLNRHQARGAPPYELNHGWRNLCGVCDESLSLWWSVALSVAHTPCDDQTCYVVSLLHPPALLICGFLNISPPTPPGHCVPSTLPYSHSFIASCTAFHLRRRRRLIASGCWQSKSSPSASSAQGKKR
ncbi:hypothetical protein CEXT_754111 [Caerostris extrusa]|uniref:Uncharacterized protein n=1 Tax=Caerostris extrusa TaxID=172846 RepID=A0AAV4Y2Z6_CAEEX|nr:hypothetical protein CEXT_754111 [Caerostris extrusa]